MVYSIADKTKYYRQNNNEIKPGIRCKPTATVEGLDLAEWPLPFGSRKQPEDNLTEWMESHLGKDSPEDWNMIVQAINGHFLPNDKPLTLRWNWTIAEALFSIVERKPFIMSSDYEWFVKKTSAGKPGETLPNIRASYQFGAGQTIATATMAPLNYGTKIKDTNSIVTVGAGWKATFPNACDVLVEAKIEFELSSWTAGTGANLYVKRYNSAGVIQEDRVVDSRVLDVTGNTYMFLKGNTSMSVQAGDYIQIVVYQTTGGNKTTGANSATCYMNIETLGRS